MSATASQAKTGTVFSHDDSTIDSKVFDWDDEIVNADMYRRAMQHARLKLEIPAKQVAKDNQPDTFSEAGTEESGDQLSVKPSDVIPQLRKPPPYEMSVATEPLDNHRPRTVIPNSSVSDRPTPRRSILSYHSKTPDVDKKSFWSTISGKRSSRSLVLPERTQTPQPSRPKGPSPGSRRGRRGFENNHHISIDFASENGLSAPPIVRAAQAGSIVEIEMLLDQHADINARHLQSGRNALSVASHCGNEEVVRLLLRYGAMVNQRDASYLSPLHLASQRGHVVVVECLLQEHADIDGKGPNDQTPLRVASEQGQIEVAEALLRKGAKVNARDSKQMTPLHVAAKQGDEAMTQLLVSSGAHIEAKDGNFMGPLHYACEGGHAGVVLSLLNKKADIEAPGRSSMTPLLVASSSGQFQVAEMLLKKKASFKHKGEGEMTALHWASFNGHVEVVDLLVQRRAPIAAVNKDGRTPLHLAVLADEFAVADLLLRKGAPVETQCKSNLKPIHYACLRAKPEMTQLLLGYNANNEAADGMRNRPLHNACTRGSLPHVELLIQKGVNIDARNDDGDRPLSLASSRGHVDVVRILLDRGATLRSKFSSGPIHEDSPLCLAAKNGHVSVVLEFINRGASVLQKDEFNWQPLRYAAFNAHPEVVELLLKHGATVSGTASGGWGFNITAQRIGFSNDVTNEEQRKGQVLRLLTSAEAREQNAKRNESSVTSPIVPPAVQSQATPTELGDPSTATNPPAEELSSKPQPLTPRVTQELNADLVGSSFDSHTDIPASPVASLDSKAPLLHQHVQPYYIPITTIANHKDNGILMPNLPSQSVPPFAPDRNFHLEGYPKYSSNVMSSVDDPQPYASMPYYFVPSISSQAVLPNQYKPAIYNPLPQMSDSKLPTGPGTTFKPAELPDRSISPPLDSKYGTSSTPILLPHRPSHERPDSSTSDTNSLQSKLHI